MNATSLSKRRRRDGLSMTEMVVTVAITTVAMVGGVQIMSLASRQCRMVEDRRLACLEAGNIMEQIMARPWEEITPGDVSAFELSEACRQTLPDARLRVEIEAEATDPGARRITIEIDWQANALRRGEPVRLVAWRYLNKEARP
jgi:Tfp pilus assembly protein PilV